MGECSSHDFAARALKDAGTRNRRRALLDSHPAHMANLIDYVVKLRMQRPQWIVPDFDPVSGGVNARALFLLEKPGPMTDPQRGSGFISIHNDDPTAASMHAFLLGRKIPVGLCLFANVIPWWDNTRKISIEQRLLSTNAVRELIGLLPKLRAIILLGNTAQSAWKRSGLLPPAGVRLYESAHPSPLVRARYPERFKAIPSHWPDCQSLQVTRVEK
jgi:hypothetical protein